MTALEAVRIWDVNQFYKGSFATLLRLPSMKLLEISSSCTFWKSGLVDRIAKDFAGRQMDQVETLVVSGWWFEGPERTWKGFRKLLRLFPNLKSLRLTGYFCLGLSVNEHCVRLGRLVRRHLPLLSQLELVLDGERLDMPSNFGAYVRLMLRGLGRNVWTLGPAEPERPGRSAARFVAHGRSRAEFSSVLFEEKFFRSK